MAVANRVGFFTDTSVCIGCKACEVACKEWNQLQGNSPNLLLDSFDNTGKLDAQNWRHVQFHENIPAAADSGAYVAQPQSVSGGQAWLMMSDVCKHCQHASCMEVCPTGAITRTEFDTVYIQQDVCNGCRNCISACPYGVIGFSPQTGTAQKCTFCYDRLQAGMTPACAKACPTESIKFGSLDDLQKTADTRLAALHQQGYAKAELYGRDDSVYGGLNAFFLLMDKPETYGLPSAANAGLPSRNNVPGYLAALVAGVLAVLGGLVAFRRRGEVPPATPNGRPSRPEPTPAGASYVLGTMLRLLGRPSDEPAARIAFIAALVCLANCPILLSLVLEQPL